MQLRGSSNTFKAYLDGVEFASDTTARTINNTLIIGGYVNTNYLMKGRIRDLRITTNVEYPSNNFTPPSEPLTAISGTVLLTCHLPYFVDGTGTYTITPNGNTSTKPFSPYDYSEYSATNHGGSVYFDGTGDVIYTSQDTAFNFGTADFTFEAWVYPTLYTSGWNTLFAIGNSTNFGGLLVGKSDDGYFVIRQYGTANIVSTTTLPDLNVWTHIACVRSGGTSKLYYNGSEIATASDTTNYSSTTPFAHIGNSDHTSYSHYWNGYVSDARFISGTAVYTGNFTPPTAPLSSSGAELHIKGTDASIIDKSQGSNLKLIGTTTGSTTQVKFANTKSMYFDGTGDYISISADDSIFSKDYTIEFWMYPTQDTNLLMPFSKGVGLQFYHQSGNIGAAMSSSNSGTYFYNGNFGSITTNAWSHISLVRDSSASTYKFYINGTLEDTLSSSANIDAGSADWIIAAYSTAGSYAFEGYIQDFRITEGLARYTASDETSNIPTAPLEG